MNANEIAFKLDRALDLLEQARKSISGANAWGIWDILGGGMISSYLKHSSVKDAKRYAEEADQILSSIDWTLLETKAPNISIDNTLAFLDLFFDDFGIDIFVQTRIMEARKELDQAISTLSYYRSLI